MRSAKKHGEIEMLEYYFKSMTFEKYFELLEQLQSEGKSTGPEQSEAMLGYSRLNLQRMKRLGKTIELDADAQRVIAGLNVDWVWLVITEGWCGDAAQNIPIIEKIASANSGIETRYILRDEYPGLMDRFLTNGARSIPKLIAIERQSGEVLGTWGPRPKAAQDLFSELKSANMPKPEILENIQRWYLSDRGRSLQAELADLASQWSRTQFAFAA